MIRIIDAVGPMLVSEIRIGPMGGSPGLEILRLRAG